ncbi:hypothetical protein KFK09_019928 [Dendrobium nobile]|uniref:Cytochrome b561 domain-containing protein n=1 Tax=Dendrobium nobile TaxID=94219 RepID=A0A8T3ASH0_DENNO|nr:hypothetical protein KFK09_019928 [Dendrobium nobile]
MLRSPGMSSLQYSGVFVHRQLSEQMQEAFMRLEQGRKSVMQYEAEFTALSRYAAHLILSPEEKCYRFLHGLNRELRHPLVPFRIHEFSELVERARLIEIDLATPVLRYEDTRGGEMRYDEMILIETEIERREAGMRVRRDLHRDLHHARTQSSIVLRKDWVEGLILAQVQDSRRTVGSRAYSERSGNRMDDRTDRIRGDSCATTSSGATHLQFYRVSDIVRISNDQKVLLMIPGRRRVRKLVHMFLNLAGLVLGVLGFFAIFTFLNKEGTMLDLDSLHSWLGFGTMCLFAIQFLLGFTFFLFPGATLTMRAIMKPWHFFFGLTIFILAIISSATGIVRRFSLIGLHRGSEALVLNFTGIAIILYGITVILSVILP